MADGGSEFSSALFMKLDGSPVEFYIAPGPEKTRLKPLIEQGGGRVTSSLSEKCIRLVVGDNVGKGHVPASYVTDCIKEDRLLPIADYKPSIRAAPRPDEEVGSSKMDASSSTASRKPNALKGRTFYTYDEDLAIYQYVESHSEKFGYTKTVGGRELWKQMEFDKVTSHTWQSMKDRYMKHIKGKFRLKTDVSIKKRKDPVATVSLPPKKVERTESPRSVHASPPKQPVRGRTVNVNTYSDDQDLDGDKNLDEENDDNNDDDDNDDDDVDDDDDNGHASYVFSDPIREDQKKRRRNTNKALRTKKPHNQLPDSDMSSTASSFDQELLETAAKTRKIEAKRRTSYLLDDPCARRSDLSEFPETQLDGWSKDVEDQWVQHIEDIMASENCLFTDVFRALYLMSGNRHDALHYLRYGCSRLGWAAWTHEEDAVLMSTNEDEIRRLQRRRSQLDVHRRIAFLDSQSASNHCA